MAPKVHATQSQTRSLEEAALSIKRRFLNMYFRANAGHVGCSLSCADILTLVRLGWMTPEDDLVLSKGHAAFASKLRHESGRRAFCITSDGELDEGSSWEAVLFAAHHRLSNLVWLVDRNSIQGFGRTEEVMSLEPLGDKFRAFNWNVHEVDGHSMAALVGARDAIVAAQSERPSVVLCHTVKGLGMGDLADSVDCHYRPMTQEIFGMLLASLDKASGALREI